jgi:hypothetical protein
MRNFWIENTARLVYMVVLSTSVGGTFWESIARSRRSLAPWAKTKAEGGKTKKNTNKKDARPRLVMQQIK